MIRNIHEQFITDIKYLHEKVKSKRQLKITLSNGTVVRAEACYESWMQYGGTESELYVTMDCVEAHNEWLHGGERPAGMGRGYHVG